MKATERHHLKQNEFAATTARVVEAAMEHRSRILPIAGIIALVLIVGGGFYYVQKRGADQASAALGAAMAIAQSPVVPPPTLPGATQQAGTFPTDQARLEAALKAFEEVAAKYPSDDSGLAAKYQMGATLLSLGRPADAETAFADVVQRAGSSSIYKSVAELGRGQALASAGKYDEAIKTFTDLSAQRDGALPVDGVLMQLARTYVKAGKPQDARAAFKRVVDEFPGSPYIAEARQQLAGM
ncbi:MAG TPA: tetratricopeptide repeat protein [Vicinamibacterales bacterium]|nr:tetratricopeptide repeat protein [Vicinamibacterales bacterium]